MHITRLDLQSYRRFEQFSIELDPKLTVIVARNGQGKTTVLEAVVAALGPFVGAFDEGRGHHLQQSDVHRKTTSEQWPANEPQYPVIVSAELARDGDSNIEWSRRLNSGKKGSKTTVKEAAPLVSWGKTLQNDVREGIPIDLPVVAYYSSNRLWLSNMNRRSRSSAILTKSRTAAYEDALATSVASFFQLEEWMKTTYLASMQESVRADRTNRFAGWLVGVSNCVDYVMAEEGWADFKFNFALDELSMDHPDHGVLPVSMLSDGVRAIISLVGDLALRCVRLNPHLGVDAPNRTKGIVLIDEVDLHLHPSWQQRVVRTLRNAFPEVQFILTTHSPQVISTVSSNQTRIVQRDHDGRWQAFPPDEQVKGLESSVALSDVMGVSPVPDIPESKMIRDYSYLVESGKKESGEGLALRKQLEGLYGPTHRVLIEADRLDRFQVLKTGLRKRQRNNG
ncbi:ATP-binding protein [Arthrobacter sp. W1]|nr:ATP-binding protein [Arthrobacter sp. W1]